MPRPIYHITQIDNLPSIIDAGCLWCDSQRLRRDCHVVRIGYEHIKERRMNRPVLVAARGNLGNYVPFNFCPRSVMLHSIWKGLVEGYEGGQERVIHLVSSTAIVDDLETEWAFTDRHAEPPEADYLDDLADLDNLQWEIIESNTWGGDVRRPIKQAEFLVHDHFPWTGFHAIGVISETVAAEVRGVLATTDQRPAIQVHRDWYYGG